MTIGDILSNLKELGTKAKGTLGSLLSSTEKAAASVPKTVADYFAPSGNGTRVRDVVREAPGATAGVAKDIARGATRFALSAGESIADIPLEAYDLVTGKNIAKPYQPKKIPGLGVLGPIESYQNETKRTGAATVGDVLKQGGTALLDEPTGVAVKPALVGLKMFAPILAGVLKGAGKEAVDEGAKAAEQVFFHGTTPQAADNILKSGFNLDTAGKNSGYKGILGQGVYLDNSPAAEGAKLYGDAVLQTKVKPGLKLFRYNGDLSDFYTKETKYGDPVEITKYLRKNGYDGIVGGNQTVIFDPKNVEAVGKLGADGAVASAKGGKAAETAIEASAKEGTAMSPVQAKKGVPKTSIPGVRTMADLLAEREGLGIGGGKPPRVPRETGPIPDGAGEIPPERRFIKRTKEMAPEAAPLLEGQYNRRSTEELVARADDLIAKDPSAAMKLAIEGTDDNAVATASRLIDNFIGQAKIATDEATKSGLYERAAEVANSAAKNLTEHGRAVQAASVLGKLTPEGMTRWAATQIQKYNEQAGTRSLRNFLGGAKKIPDLTGEQAKSIVDQMTAIEKMTDPEAKAIAFSKLNKEIKALVPSSLYAKIITLWKAGLLTGIKTTGLNILSNASHAASEIVKDVPAALVDRVVSLFTGKRALALTTKGALPGAKDGVAKGWRFFKTGYDERDALGALDFHQVNFGKGPVAQALQKYEETVFNLLGAEDQPFYYGAKARSLYSQAIAEAKNLGLKGKAFTSKVDELVANPTDQMLKYAVMDAQTAVFQNKTALGTVAKALQRAPGGEIILPFGKTPAAVATQMFNYTPVGLVGTIIGNIGKGRFDQRLFAQGIGRGLTGTGVLAIGAALARNGLITGSFPSSEKEQKQWQLEGKTANAIKVGDKWRGIGPMGPLGMVLSIGAALQNGVDQTGSIIGGIGQALAAGGSALTQQSFLYGINNAINALNDPTRYGATFINNTIGSVIPTLVADIARSTDQYERRTSTATQRLVSRIPGLRELLQPQVDTFGTKIETPDFITTMADPTRPGTATAAPNDPVVKELRRLSDSGYSVTPTMLGTKQGYKTLSGAENTNLWVNAGKAAKKAIADITKDSVYPTLDDEQKSKLIAKVVDDAETQARARAVLNATKNLKGKALDARIKEMVEDKLVTKTVYKWYSALGGLGNYPLQ